LNSSIPSKHIGSHHYFHIEVLDFLDKETLSRITNARNTADLNMDGLFNVIKLSEIDNAITFLDYCGLHEEAFPQLRKYWRVDQSMRHVRYRTYESSLNPPILHRKELLLFPEHPRYAVYESLTSSAEQIGLFDDPNRIGFKRAWEDLLAKRGFKVVDHQFVPIGNDESTLTDSTKHYQYGVARHLTALTRYDFSAPLQAILRVGFLDGSRTVFDYGCGRGDDLSSLRASNINAAGWDPYFAPKEPKTPAHVVNLGFVINVIENIDERIEALRSAYALSQEVLVVSAMLANQEAVNGTPYGDGLLTSRNTFQKYYTQAELRHFICETLDVEPVPVAPGIFFVFKDKEAEQRFMYGRLENHRNILRMVQMCRPSRSSRTDSKYEAYQALLERLWETCMIYGRSPDRSEVANLGEIISAFGSLTAAIRFISLRKENAQALLDAARENRINDLQVYFAQLQFEKRKPYKQLEQRLKTDIRVFFGDYRTAAQAGRQLLFKVANVGAISEACHEAAEHGIGWLEDSESLQLHTSLVEQLPPVLRTYISCGAYLYGDVTSADLIKIHIRSGKLSLMKFDDFVGKPLPTMIQRVKLNLRTLDLQLFDYVPPYEPPYLYEKSRFVNEEFPHYGEQLLIEEQLNSLGLLRFEGYGPMPHEFDAQLERKRYTIKGYALERSRSLPSLDENCGENFTYKQLIECGATWEKHRISNLPKQADSFTAILELAKNILDPVVEYFGMIHLTYGFCSPELAKLIPKRIAPELDQHSAHEIKRNGNVVCKRLGAACDFIIDDEDMEEVVQWIAQNLPFDRIYYIDSKRPIHVSYGPDLSGQIVKLVPNSSGRLIPRVVTRGKKH
jgi:DNA phosphorothioation-associated putative methyltransferase